MLCGAPDVALTLPWPVPLASFSIAIDPLSALFLLPTFAIGALAAVYGAGSRASWLWLNLLLAGMALAIVARNGVLFLVAWEAMTIASWFLLSRVEVMAPEAVGAIVAFGDSITDGTGSTVNANNRWPDLLARRLSAEPGGVKMPSRRGR